MAGRILAVILSLMLLGGAGWYWASTHLVGPSAPYLQKFDGRWHLALVPDKVSQTSGVGCPDQESDVSVRNGSLSDQSLLNRTLGLEASITPEGALSGTFMMNKSRDGIITATLSGSSGQGTWRDNFECKGTLTLKKIDPVIDPVVARVVSAHQAVLVRAGESRELLPGMVLYAGDRVEAREGGQALLAVGIAQTPISVFAAVPYLVSEPQVQ